MTVDPEGYRDLESQLRTSVERHAEGFQLGAMMPSEAELVRSSGLSRDTVRRALAGLRADGLITVVRGKGLRINPLPVITRDAQTRFRIRAEGDARGAYEAELARHGLGMHQEATTTVGQPPKDIAEILGNEPVIIRDRKMYAVRPDDPAPHPVQLAVSWIPRDLVPPGNPIEMIDSGPGGTYSRLEELGHKPVLFEERITVRRAAPYEAQFLQTDSEQRVYMIRRTARDAEGRIVEVIDTVTPIHQQELVYRWEA